MTPGRQLDIIIARGIFNMHKQSDDYIECERLRSIVEKSKYNMFVELMQMTKIEMRYYGIGFFPYYSTDIAAAWLLVDKIHKDTNLVFQLVAPQQDGSNEKWRALFSKKYWDNKNPYLWECESDTAPHAICLAALDVMRIELK